MPSLTLAILAATLASAPPLAGVPDAPPEQAASPVVWDDLPFFHVRRLRMGVLGALNHTQIHNPGGNALGVGVSLALEQRADELAASIGYQGGIASEDARGRNTGLSLLALKLLYRVVPFQGEHRFMLEAGVQGAVEGAFAYCSIGKEDTCRHVRRRPSVGAVLGTVFLFRGERRYLAIGLDAVVKTGNAPAPIGAGPLALQLWAEAGLGGVRW
jgi:hypothetical protein